MALWDGNRARDHMQDHKAFTTSDEWKATPLQVFRLFENDFLYQCRAFKHVVPARPLNPDDSVLYMKEDWRSFQLDVGFFACLHCRQFSKTKFCEDVSQLSSCAHSILFKVCPCHFILKCVTIMLAEGVLLPSQLPAAFQSKGVESNVGHRTQSTQSNVYGVIMPLNTPEKANSQRYSSQGRSKRS